MKVSKALAFTNARRKFYFHSDGTPYLYNTVIFPDETFKKHGFELCRDFEDFDKSAACILKNDVDNGGEADNSAENRRKAFNRAKNALFDLLMCNTDCNYFCTLTLDENKVDRHDYKAVMRKLSVMLDNAVRRKKLKYILVPEFHKDGAVHFHGLLNAEVLKLSEAVSPYSGLKLSTKNGKQIYNIDSFKLGFSTAIRIGDDECERNAVAKYCYKYVLKSGGQKVGGRYYLSGGDLRRPLFETFDTDYLAIEAPVITLSYGGECKIVRA